MEEEIHPLTAIFNRIENAIFILANAIEDGRVSGVVEDCEAALKKPSLIINDENTSGKNYQTKGWGGQNGGNGGDKI